MLRSKRLRGEGQIALSFVRSIRCFFAVDRPCPLSEPMTILIGQLNRTFNHDR